MTVNQNQYHANQEVARHNRVMEQLQKEQNLQTSLRDAETRRANVAKERENTRSNRASEINTQEYNMFSNEHWARQDSEANRHNKQSELLTDQQNTNTFVVSNAGNSTREGELREKRRSNKANEGVAKTRVMTDLLGSLGQAVSRVIGKGKR